MPKFKSIVFDLGEVGGLEFLYVYRKIFDNDEEKIQWFFQNICTPDWNEEQDGGRTLAEGTELLVGKFLSTKETSGPIMKDGKRCWEAQSMERLRS
jgi:2-haloacid dehalogenase